MYFNYDEYRKNNLFLPIVAIIAALLFIVVNIIEMIDAIQQGKSFAYEIGAIFLTLLFIIVAGSVIRTGWYLFFETPKDMQYSEGEIQRISSAIISPIYIVNGKPIHPSWVYVNGAKFHFMDASHLIAGRKIAFGYLPKCSFVLYYDDL